ncbi:MAG: histidine triad nucleotide-binding protein [bacterium]|nr:histidine triad nucleotide-binding protein [bacterium]
MLDQDCLFCKIIQKKIPAELVFEDDQTLVFKDIYPKASIHLLVIPKKHVSGVTDPHSLVEINAIWSTINKVTEKLAIKDKGFRLVINSGHDGRQEVNHLHFHILAGERLKVL